MRHSATRALFERRDVVIVASVSCIYGLGSPEAYHGMMLLLERGMSLDRDVALRKLVEIQYERTPADLRRGAFRVRGDTVEIWPSYAETALRVEFWGDEVETLARLDPVRGTTMEALERHPVYPNSHYVTPREDLLRAVESIEKEVVEPPSMGLVAIMSDAGFSLHQQPAPRVVGVHLLSGQQVGIPFEKALEQIFTGIRSRLHRLQRVPLVDEIDAVGQCDSSESGRQ